MYRTDIPGWMHEKDLQVIVQLASAVSDNGIIVEVGSWLGQSTYAWAANTKAKVYAIDLWKWMPKEYRGSAPEKVDLKGDPYEQFAKNVADLDNVVPLRRNSSGGEWGYQPADIVFIDAMHQNPWVAQDIEYWEPKVKPGGILCGDDYSTMFPAVQEESQKLADRLGVHLELPGQKFWLVRKPSASL
jgi:predicted O-methyltransferase YrrM